MGIKRLVFLALLFVLSCEEDKEKSILSAIRNYNALMQDKTYHFGDVISFPPSVIREIQSISMDLRDKNISDLKITSDHFRLGDNEVVFRLVTNAGKSLSQEATISVFAAKPEMGRAYEVLGEYPHDTENFVQGFHLEGDTIYESNGGIGRSKMIKYKLGTITPDRRIDLSGDFFGEGSAVVGDKVYQLTWKHRKGFIYDKHTLKKIGEMDYPKELREGWGLTFDGQFLIASDGTENLYFFDPDQVRHHTRVIKVAGYRGFYHSLNELEYHKGFVYANVWQQSIVIKINPETGEVVEKFDFSALAQENTKGDDDVLNGVSFKGDHMLVTGKNWPKIYEVKLK